MQVTFFFRYQDHNKLFLKSRFCLSNHGDHVCMLHVLLHCGQLYHTVKISNSQLIITPLTEMPSQDYAKEHVELKFKSCLSAYYNVYS